MIALSGQATDRNKLVVIEPNIEAISPFPAALPQQVFYRLLHGKQPWTEHILILGMPSLARLLRKNCPSHSLSPLTNKTSFRAAKYPARLLDEQ